MPIRLGQEFAAYAVTVRKARVRVADALEQTRALHIGGTAAGTGLNTDPRYAGLMVARLSELAGVPLRAADDLVQATQSLDDFVAFSGALRGAALSLIQIANDLRLLSSGPRTGLAEITLPPVQPGSSIMPGKVNPVMAEMLDMVCFHVVGADAAVALAAQAGQLEINVMTPLVAFELLFALQVLSAAVLGFTERCVRGIAGQRGQLPPLGRAQPRPGDRAEPGHRLRGRGRGGQGGPPHGQVGARGGAGARHPERRRAGGAAGSGGADPAAPRAAAVG